MTFKCSQTLKLQKCGNSHHSKEPLEWARFRSFLRERKQLVEGRRLELLDPLSPVGAHCEVLFEPLMSEEELGVAIHGLDDSG